jgi:hypothetical protein
MIIDEQKLKERSKLKTAKSTYKSTKKNHPVLFKQLQDEFIRAFIKYKEQPTWLSKFTITN